jgi:hypothetical protein
MKVEIKNPNSKALKIVSLFDYLSPLSDNSKWNYNGLIVNIDPTFDFKGDNVLIRWADINEGFNDKLIVNSLQEFKSIFLFI